MTESLIGKVVSKEEISQASAHTEEKWFPTRGRIKGQTYFIKMTAVMTLFIGVGSLLLLLSTLRLVPILDVLFLPVMYFILFAAVLSMMCYTAQRLRDTGNKAWLAIFILVPSLNLILFLCLIFAPSVVGTNAHHASPESRLTKLITLALIPIAPLSSAFFMTVIIALMLPISIFVAFIFYSVMIDKSEDNHCAPTTSLQTVIVTISIILLPFLMGFGTYLSVSQLETWWGKPLMFTLD